MSYPLENKTRPFGWLGWISVGLLSVTTLLLFGPPDVSSRRGPDYNAIVNNLRVIQNQKQLWSAEKKRTDQDIPTKEDLAPYFNTGKFPNSICGEIYHINSVGQNPTATVSQPLKVGRRLIPAGGQVTLEEF